jgi:O-antigen/teichoic acid export membrane protein
MSEQQTNMPSEASEPTQPAPPAPSASEGYARILGRNVFYGFLAKIITFASNFFFLAYVIRKLGTEAYGLVALAVSTVMLISLVQLGGSTGVAKKLTALTAKGDNKEFGRYFSASAAIYGGIGALVFLIVLLVTTLFWSALRVPDAFALEGRFVLAAVGVAAVLSCVSTPLTACFQAAHRIDVFEKIQVTSLLTRMTATVAWFELFGASPGAYAVLLLIDRVVQTGLVWWWVRRNLPAARFKIASITQTVIKDLIGFNVQVMAIIGSYLIFLQTPAILLQRSYGLEAVAMYGIAINIHNMLRGLFVVGLNAIRPLVISLEARGDREQTKSVFLLSGKLFIGVSGLVWVGMLLFGQPFLMLWLGKDMPPLTQGLPILMAAFAMGLAAMPGEAVLMAMGRIKATSIAGVVMASAMIPAMIWLAMPQAGVSLVRVGFVMIGLYGTWQLMRLILAAVYLTPDISLLFRKLLLPSIIPAISGGAVLWLGLQWFNCRNVLPFISMTLLSVLTAGVASFFLMLSHSERSRVRQMVFGFVPIRKASN